MAAPSTRPLTSTSGTLTRRAWLAAGATSASPVASAKDKTRFAVALGSGSSHGLAHVGVVRACEQLSLVPDLIVGSSVGAAVGVLWAGGLSSVRIERVAAGMDWSSAGSWTVPWRGLRRNDGLQRAIDSALQGRTIESLPRPFVAAATRLDNGQGVALDSGPAGAAVAASSAVPVLFVPVRRDGIDLIDGSLSAPLPVDIARQRGATVVLAVDVAYRPSEAPARDITDVAFQSMHILINALAAEQAARADVVLRLNVHHLAIGAGSTALIAAGERAMHEAWPQLRARLGR